MVARFGQTFSCCQFFFKINWFSSTSLSFKTDYFLRLHDILLYILVLKVFLKFFNFLFVVVYKFLDLVFSKALIVCFILVNKAFRLLIKVLACNPKVMIVYLIFNYII